MCPSAPTIPVRAVAVVLLAGVSGSVEPAPDSPYQLGRRLAARLGERLLEPRGVGLPCQPRTSRDVPRSARTASGYSPTTQATGSATRCLGGCGLAHSSRLDSLLSCRTPLRWCPSRRPEAGGRGDAPYEVVLAADGAVDLDAAVSLRVEPRLSRHHQEMRRPLALGRSDLAATAQALVVQRAVAARPIGPGGLGAPVDRAFADIDLLPVMAEAQARA